MTVWNPPTAAAVRVIKIGTATYDQLQEIHDLTRAAGHLDGGEITPGALAGDINVAAGQGFIRGLNDDISTLYAFDWAAASAITIPTNSIRYVRVNYAGGTPVIAISANEDYDYRTSFPLGFVVNEGGTLFINETPHNVGRFAGRFARRNYEVDGRSRANQLGGLIISESGTKNVAVSAGVTWLRGLREDFPAFDSSVSGNFDGYYRDGGTGFTKDPARTAVPDGLWDDNTGVPKTIGPNNFVNYWMYLGPSNGIVLLYGRGDHNTLGAAQNETAPATLPLRLQVGSLLLGRFIMERQPGPTFVIVETQTAFVGLAGGTGPAGPQGAQGVQGDRGAPGMDGEEGSEGVMGPPGLAGPQGAAGAPGAIGATGPAGAPGMDGEEGPEGWIGPPGPVGPQGAAGAPGAPGATGPRGLSIPGQDGEDADVGMMFPPGVREVVPITITGTILAPSAPINVIAWRAPFAATVKAVKGYRVGGTAATINARRNGTSNHLASDLSLGSTDTWLDGGAVQNVAYVTGDKLEIRAVTLAGSPTQIAIQVDFTRP